MLLAYLEIFLCINITNYGYTDLNAIDGVSQEKNFKNS